MILLKYYKNWIWQNLIIIVPYKLVYSFLVNFIYRNEVLFMGSGVLDLSLTPLLDPPLVCILKQYFMIDSFILSCLWLSKSITEIFLI